VYYTSVRSPHTRRHESRPADTFCALTISQFTPSECGTSFLFCCVNLLGHGRCRPVVQRYAIYSASSRFRQAASRRPTLHLLSCSAVRPHGSTDGPPRLEIQPKALLQRPCPISRHARSTQDDSLTLNWTRDMPTGPQSVLPRTRCDNREQRRAARSIARPFKLPGAN